jgi:hypothetical protein
MSFQRTSIFMTADDRKAVGALQKRYGLSTMSETIRFALRLATAFAPKESHHIVPSGRYKPAIPSAQVHRLITRAQRINQRVEERVRFNETLLAQRQAYLNALSATRDTSQGAGGRDSQ